jgi:hypothetical protein
VVDDRRSGIQKLFMGLVSPATALRMETESRSWMIRCPACNYERSVWETGGIRYKASGTARQLRQCPQCGKRTWHTVYRREEPSAAGPASVSTAGGRSRLLLWVLVLGVFLAGSLAFFGILFFVTNTLTQPVATSGDAFMTALKTGNYAPAYALCAPDLQQELGNVAGLATLVGTHQPAQWNWTSRSIRNGVGQVQGPLTYADGASGTVHLVFQQVDNDWKLVSFRMNPR